MIVDCAVYQDGHRAPGSTDLEHCMAQVDGSNETAFLWLGLAEPSEQEFDDVARRFNLHPLAVEDAVHAHQRPKIELYGAHLFMVIKPARYVDSQEVIELDQVMVFIGDDFVITVRHGLSDVVGRTRATIDGNAELRAWGPLAVLHTLCDLVVDDYAVVIRGLEADIAEIEEQVFTDAGNHGERIYFLKREVLQFRQAVAPLADPLDDIVRGSGIREGTSRVEYFRDVHDHVLRISERVDTLDQLLSSALSANLAQIGIRQNEDMRKISAWVAIAAVPTMIAGIYGMNFDHMPELRWEYGYLMVVTFMAAVSLFLYRRFKSSGWL